MKHRDGESPASDAGNGEDLTAEIAAASPGELTRRAGDRRAGVRRLVASHPETPPAVLARLAEDGNLWVRRDAAANPATPREALDRLYRAGSARGLAGPAPPDPTLDPAELAELAGGGEWARRLAARHPATPPEALARLAEDPIPAIRTAAVAHPAAPAEARARVRSSAIEEARREAGDPSTPPPRLAELAALPDPELRWAVARHPATPPEAFERLTEDAVTASGGLALAIALSENPSCPPTVLSRLAEHGAVVVRERVAARPGYAGAHRDLLRRAGSGDDLASFVPPDPDLRASDLTRLAEGGGWARLLAARHPATEPDLLARLAADPDPLVRREALAHPRCAREAASEADLGTGDGGDERVRRALRSLGSLDGDAADGLEENARRIRSRWR